MDITQAKAILDKYGRENCMQIIFDNGRVWLTCVPKRSSDPKEAKRGLPARDPITKKILFEYFDDLVTFDETTDSVCIKEHQPGTSQDASDYYNWYIVNPCEGIQGFTFIPSDLPEEQKYRIREQWDHTIV